MRHGTWLGLALLVATAAPVRAQTTRDIFKVEDKLTNTDALDRVLTKSHHKVHTVRLLAGRTYTIDLVSKQFDAYLRLEDAAGRELAKDDDSGGTLNARIVFSAPRDDTYRIIATSYAAGSLGAYLLTIKESVPANQTAQAREILRFDDRLTATDPLDKVLARSRHKVHVARLAAGKTYTIDLMSSQFDAYLRLEDSSGQQLAKDDDGGVGLNARIQFLTPRDDAYRIIATSFAADATGAYTLLVNQSAKAGLTLEKKDSVRHPSAVTAIVITPDSRTAFIGLDDGALLAYALATRRPMEVGFRVYSPIRGLAINAGGDRLAVADGDGVVRLLDTGSLTPDATVRLPAQPDHLTFAGDEQSLYVALANGHLLKLDGRDLSTQRDILPTEGSRILALASSRDGQVVATSDRDGKIKLWTAGGLDLQKAWKAHDRYARSMAFDPAGEYLVSGGEEAVLKCWQISDHALVKESKEYHQQSIATIACAADGRLVTGGQDGLCQFWAGCKLEPGRSYPNYRGYITASAISPDGKWLVRGGSSLDFVPLDRPDDFERVADYGGAILTMAAAPDRKSIVTAGLDRRLILWNVDGGFTAKGVLADDWVTAVAFGRAGEAIVAGLANGTIAVHDTATLRRAKSWQAHEGWVTGIAAVAGQLVSLGDDQAVHFWDMDGRRLKTFQEEAACRSFAVQAGRLAIGTANGTVSLYDVPSGSPGKRLRLRPQSVTALAFTRDGTRLLAGYFDGSLEVFDAAAGASLEFRAGRGSSVLTIAPSPKNDLIAVGFRDGSARLYDSLSLDEGPTLQTRPAREIFAIQWLTGDRSLALAGADNGVVFCTLQGDPDAWLRKNRSRQGGTP